MTQKNNPQLTAHSSQFTLYCLPHPAFTLAEVLIALVVIGVVAALVIPSFAMNETQKAYDQAQNVGLIRIREATNQMKTNDVLAGYATNEAFADEFAKYMKFGRRCTSANLAKCFAPKFKLPDNTEIDTTTLTTGTALGHATYTANTVGIGLVNGTNMILAFDPACPRIDPYNNTTDTTACLAVIYDINGAGKPNQVGKDIALLNVTFSTGCAGTKIGGLCVDNNDTTFSPSNEPCIDITDYCAPPNGNYWAGARDACITNGKRLPTIAEAQAITSGTTSLSEAYWTSEDYPAIGILAFGFVPSENYIGPADKASSACKARCVK